MSPAASPGALALVLAICCSGCALLGKGKPLALRYFDLDSDASYQPSARAPSARLKLGSVSAARHIERRFVSRRSAYEVSYHDEWRFSDEPDAYLRRMLEQSLFERAGLTRVLSGAAPTLELELIAFEEDRQKGPRRARVAVLASLRDDRVQLWQRTFVAEDAVGAGEEAAALAAALSKALGQVTGDITAQVIATVPRPAPPPE